MPLPVFDAAKHHIGIKQVGVPEWYGFVLDGQYQRSLVREGQPEMEFGGEKDLIAPVPGRSRWTQDDFTGGVGQREWGDDEAMFSKSRNIIPSVQDSSVISVPPMLRKTAKNVSTDAGATDPAYPVAQFAVAGSIYTAFEHGIYRYVIDTGVFTFFQVPGGVDVLRDAMYDQAAEIIWYLVDAPGAQSYINRVKTDLTLPGGQTLTWKVPVKLPYFEGRGIEVMGQRLIIGIGQQLYSFDPPEDLSAAAPAIVQGQDGQIVFGTAGDEGTGATFKRIGRMPGRWKASVAYNGLVYVLCASTADVTSLIATDGASILPIATFPFNFIGRSMVQYGGRLFVGGSGLDIAGNDRYAELYEVTGSSIRLVRTFQPDSYVSGEAWPETITDLCVADGLLWFSENGVKLWAYDVTTDGFFGASELQAPAGFGPQHIDIYKLTLGRERLYGWVRSNHPTDRGADGLYRVAVAPDVPAAYTAEVETSDFANEIGRKKRWAEIRVLARYQYVELEASLDGGATWFALTEIQAGQTGGEMFVTKADLTGLSASPQVRFRIKMPRGTATAQFAELVAYTVTFVYEDTHQKVWSFTIANVDQIEGVNDLTQTYSPAEVADQFWLWMEQKTVLELNDLDGITYRVTLVDLSESKPLIGKDKREGYLSLQFAELPLPAV